MFRTASKLFFVAMLSLVCVASASQAQGPGNPAGVSQFKMFTIDSVPQMLQEAGLQYQVFPGINPSWKVTNPLNANDPGIEIYLLKNPQGQVVGLNLLSGLKLPPAGGFTQAELTKLMHKYSALSPYVLCVHPTVGDICLTYNFCLPNSNAQELKQVVTNFARIIDKNRDVWAKVGEVQNKTVSLPGTTWTGSENLQGFGTLKFQFQANGQVKMINAKNTAIGTYTVVGNQMTIQLPEIATYTGTVNGSTYSGQGKAGQVTWSFSVNLSK
jgi:hypothetical protein